MSAHSESRIPQEPPWNVLFAHPQEAYLASNIWNSVVKDMLAAGVCPGSRRHLIKQLCFAQVFAERAARIASLGGAVAKAPSGDDVNYNVQWAVARKAMAMVERCEASLGLTSGSRLSRQGRRR